MNIARPGMCLATIAAITMTASESDAYHPVPGFHLEANAGGASRVYFTGSPRWDGQDCGTCHVDAPGQVRFHLSSTPEDIFTTGRYEPGQAYVVTIDVTGAEGKGLRTWMLETLDDDLADVGAYFDIGGCFTVQGTPRGCLQPSCTFMCKNQQSFRATCAPDGDPICSEVRKIPGCEYCGSGDGCTGCTTVDGVVGGVVVPPPWRFELVAPAAGTGPVTMYFGGVAGTSDHTSRGDDYEMQFHRLCEGPTDCSEGPASEGEQAGDYTPEPSAPGGCSAGGGHTGWPPLLLALLILRRRGSSET